MPRSMPARGIRQQLEGDEEIVVLGGKAENYVFLKSVEAFDFETRTSSPMPDAGPNFS